MITWIDLFIGTRCEYAAPFWSSSISSFEKSLITKIRRKSFTYYTWIKLHPLLTESAKSEVLKDQSVFFTGKFANDIAVSK